MIIRNMRWGCDGAVESSYIAELMVTAEDDRNYFVTCSQFCEFCKVEVSEVSLFDLEMELMDGEVDFEYELEKLKKLPIETYDSEVNYNYENDNLENDPSRGFGRYYDQSMFKSRFAQAVRLGLMALDTACAMDEPSIETAAEYIKDYIDKDISNMEFSMGEQT